MHFRVLCIACLLPVTCWAADAPPAFPDDATLGRQHVPAVVLPSDAQAARTGQKARNKLAGFHPGKAGTPGFPVIPDQAGKGVDFSEVIENVNKAKQAEHMESSSTPNLLVFVSFSMPKESLKRLARQAEQAGAAIVLRGLVADAKGRPSFHATGMAVGRLDLQQDQGFSVNPMAFERFGIRQVPSFVLLTESDCQACGDSFTPGHLKLAGDVSLDYALRFMERRRPEYAARVQPYLARLQTGFFREGSHAGNGRK